AGCGPGGAPVCGRRPGTVTAHWFGCGGPALIFSAAHTLCRRQDWWGLAPGIWVSVLCPMACRGPCWKSRTAIFGAGNLSVHLSFHHEHDPRRRGAHGFAEDRPHPVGDGGAWSTPLCTVGGRL